MRVVKRKKKKEKVEPIMTVRSNGTKEDKEVEDEGRTRTADKGRIKTGAYILNTRGFTG